jgi:hypothetical protein
MLLLLLTAKTEVTGGLLETEVEDEVLDVELFRFKVILRFIIPFMRPVTGFFIVWLAVIDVVDPDADDD